MKTTKILIAGMLLIISGNIINAQSNIDNDPHSNFKVEREYDEDGNLIRYDSVYTYSWSTFDDSTFTDSLSHVWEFNFDNSFGGMFPDHSFFFHNDSLIGNNFDYFFQIPDTRNMYDDDWSMMEKHMMEQMQEMDKIIKEMQQRHDEMFRELEKRRQVIPAPEDSVIYQSNPGYDPTRKNIITNI